VVNHHDSSWVPIDVQVWPEIVPDGLACWPPYFDLRGREQNGVHAVMSSGITDDVAAWTLLPNPSVVRLDLADPGFAVSRLPAAASPREMSS
jgi:hypothetical protein